MIVPQYFKHVQQYFNTQLFIRNCISFTLKYLCILEFKKEKVFVVCFSFLLVIQIE